MAALISLIIHTQPAATITLISLFQTQRAVFSGFGDQWECLTSGECFGHLSQCLDDAASKQTVISPQLRETLGPNYLKELNIEQLSSGNYRVISAAKMNSLVVRKMIKRR